MVMARTLIAILAAGLLAPASGWAQQAPTKPAESAPKATKASAAEKGLTAADRKFMTEAAQGGLAEVEMGKLAGERATNDAVKQFGQRMVTDHGRANEELKGLAQQKGVALPTELDAKHKKLQERLSRLSGAEFDRAYMEEMVKDHRKDVSEFRGKAKGAKDPDLKAWAGKTLPTLEEHLKQAQAVQGQVKTAGRTTR
jgi:putative membrane protein